MNRERKAKFRLLILACIVVVSDGAVQAAESLSLEVYLDQVRSGNQGLQGAVATSSGANQRSAEGSLLLAPSLFSTIQLSKDKREPISSLQGTESSLNTYSLGVSKLTNFGLQGKLFYSLSYDAVKGVSPAFRSPVVHNSGWNVELSQSLWRNALGRETQATQRLLEAQAMAVSFSEGFRVTAILADAESTYWRLALAKELVAAQKENLERAEKMLQWSNRRARLQLADRADLYQAEAALLARRLELKAGMDEERAAASAFNTLRGQSSNVVSESLARVDPETVYRLSIPGRAGTRADLKAAEQQMVAATADAVAGSERNKPNLEIFAIASINGRDPRLGEAVPESLTSQFPTYAAGVRFTTPLEFGTLSSVREGRAREAAGAELNYERKRFEQDRFWDDLVTRFAEGRERLKLATEIEQAQSKKLSYERDRLSRGRTTTFQVLQFENDLAVAQISRVRLQAEVLGLFANIKTFGVAQ